jgi:hypothetical protein
MCVNFPKMFLRHISAASPIHRPVKESAENTKHFRRLLCKDYLQAKRFLESISLGSDPEQ